MQDADWWIDHAAHKLHHRNRTFECSRDIEAMAVWNNLALLLSSDTDCLSLWDADGLLRIARAGVYPQDMAVADDHVAVCGGADCRLHLLTLPELHPSAEIHLPGMPERITLQGTQAHVLILLIEPEIHTILISADLASGKIRERMTLPGIPGAMALDDSGLWIGVSELVAHLPHDAHSPDMVVKGIELAKRIEVCPGGVTITDALQGRSFRVHYEADNTKGALTLR